MSRRLAWLSLFLGVALFAPRQTMRVAAQPAGPSAAVDAAFVRFFDASTPGEMSPAASAIAVSGITFDEALLRLKRGRSYSAAAPRGVVQKSRRDESVE